tara:strand:+ start:4768 stop:6318 length:1551 start_codon:yes stop_codon:yes gene_type:complete
MLLFRSKNSLKIKKSIEILSVLIGILIIIYYRIAWMHNHFYINGAAIWDTGWFAHLISNPSIGLGNPKVILSNSYYDTHFSPALGIYSIISPFKSFSLVTQLGIFIGLCNCLNFPLIYIALKNNLKLQDKYYYLLGVYIFSLIFTLLSEPERLVRFPHFEIVIITLIGYSLIFFCQRRNLLTWFPLILSLGFREDAGFHISIIYLTIYIYLILMNNKISAFNNSKFYQDLSGKLSLFGTISSIVIIKMKTIFFKNDNAFTRVYSGEDFYSHLNLEILKNQLIEFLHTQKTEGYWLIIPFAIFIALFLLTKNILYILGYISVAPWFLIHITAISPVASRLQAHYGFPFLIGILIPIILINSPIDKKKTKIKTKTIILTLILTSTIIIVLNKNYIQDNYNILSSKYISSTNIALNKISIHSNELQKNNILVSIPIVSFMPDAFEHKNVAEYKKLHPEEVNGLIYMKGTYINEYLMNYINTIFPKNQQKTEECVVNRNSKIYGIFKKEVFKQNKFICSD